MVICQDFCKRLFESFREAEDLESLPDLHLLCTIMHDIFNLNDQTLWEFLLADEVFFDIVSILECKATSAHLRLWYRDPADIWSTWQTIRTSPP